MSSTLKATVRNGRLVLDEPTELPEGTVVELVNADDDPYVYLDREDPFDHMSEEERDRLHASLEKGRAQHEQGQGIPADEVLERLRAL